MNRKAVLEILLTSQNYNLQMQFKKYKKILHFSATKIKILDLMTINCIFKSECLCIKHRLILSKSFLKTQKRNNVYSALAKIKFIYPQKKKNQINKN